VTGTSSLLPIRERDEKMQQEVIYRGLWPGMGKVYNIKVKNGYTTIILKPGENIKQRSIETIEKFAGQSGGDS
jgi:hypothetical protein